MGNSGRDVINALPELVVLGIPKVWYGIGMCDWMTQEPRVQRMGAPSRARYLRALTPSHRVDSSVFCIQSGLIILNLTSFEFLKFHSL